MVIKNTFLSNTDNASVSLRKLLLESCNLHTVLDCPGGTFQGAGVKTVVLFFEKGAPTRQVWYYQLDPGRNLGKTNPLNDADLAEFVELQRTRADSAKSWTLDAKAIDPATFDLSVKNPNGGEAIIHRGPLDILDEIAALDAESAEVLGNIRGMLGMRAEWQDRVPRRNIRWNTASHGTNRPKPERSLCGLWREWGEGPNRQVLSRQAKYHRRPKGSAGEINLTEEKFWPLDVTYFVTFDECHYDLRFLYYLFTTLDLREYCRGRTTCALTGTKFIHKE